MAKNERIGKFCGSTLVQNLPSSVVLKNKSIRGSHWTIDHLPKRGKKPFRLRWKNLKSIGNPKDRELETDHYFETSALAKAFAGKKIEEYQRIGKRAAELGPDMRARVLAEAARALEKGIDPIAALAEGVIQLETYGEHGEAEIGSFWPDYVARKKEAGEWGTRYLRAQESFFDETKETFMRRPVKTFISAASGRDAVAHDLEKYRSRSKRNAKNSIRGAKSKMKSFLSHVAAMVDALKAATVSEIFSRSYLILPTGTRAEAADASINAKQAKYLIQYMAERRMAGWIVFKLFMGARTLHLQQWQWSVVNWEREMIRIPKDQTKLKKNEIRFTFDDIPNFKQWLEWAWNTDGSPTPETPICRFSQPTITKHVAKAINLNKGLFTDDKRKTIKPAETLRNFMRSGFITHGIERLGVGKVIRIAENKHNLNRYIANDSATGGTAEADKFWSLTPDQITLNPLPPPPPRTRKPRSTRKRRLDPLNR